CFVITDIGVTAQGARVYTLSRAEAQRRCMEQYVSRLTPGDVIPARVTHLESFGAFVDIGCGIPSLIPIDAISVSRISHPADRFYNGQYIYAAVKSFDGSRVCLTHRELLGTWEQNCARFEVGAIVTGIVRSIESYGVFIELAPNLAGLAEPHPGLIPGQTVTVGIKAMKPEKMKLKLALIDADHTSRPPASQVYYIKEGHIDRWRYSPERCTKLVETVFQ
ncbi:MAG: S1 RNA-binding domain-containing protein, partial [Ruminococcus sp.]|nr:S1 RNA-binding domain-containing protein [Ruminococcus sp.]